MKLVLVRHGESEWNRENRFTGWTDVELSSAGRDEASLAGDALRDAGYAFDICHTSYLKRAVHTLDIILDRLDGVWLPVAKTWRLNERHYGALQGLNKSETAEKYGDAQVKIWRRSFDVQPPPLSPDDGRSPGLDARYEHGPIQARPLTESLKDTVARAIPYFESTIKPDMLLGKRVLVVAHGNSLRALVKHFSDISDADISQVNIPTGVPLVYEFSSDFKAAQMFYLGDEALISQKMEAVANQGRAK
ncbi:MAG: 2,3-diphosphoglycerate-dependent phosphoglycerate mutase [Oscillospiraceae bacterium]|jgi:2,3-bisphosphoglycerate-dependent phosphoglycerate mutase|nr:2,3-diphosphoglycerate-dependent phosphoglycerate mutase [Oscillospiraceae bacterium]